MQELQALLQHANIFFGRQLVLVMADGGLTLEVRKIQVRFHPKMKKKGTQGPGHHANIDTDPAARTLQPILVAGTWGTLKFGPCSKHVNK